MTNSIRGLATSEQAIFLLLIGYLYEELARPLIRRVFAIFRDHAHFPHARPQL